MKFKKLTLAAAISIGIASVATVGAFADASQDLACGCAPTTPLAACPCEVQPACPCEPQCFDCCEPQPACPCEPVCCEPCDKPVCGTANNYCDDLEKGSMRYAYPESIFSGSNVSQADPYSIRVSDKDGVSVAESQKDCCGCAVNMPVISSECQECGAAAPMVPNCCTITTPFGSSVVNHDCTKMDGAACPIQIKTETSLDAVRKSYNCFQMPTTGCATPVAVSSVFRDIPDGYWATCDINKLVSKNVIAGYPDRTFKPTLPVSRAEFSSLIANGLDLCRCAETTCPAFSDVSGHNWANSVIQRSVVAGYMAGYPDCTFKPDIPVSRAEAITTIAKAFKCPELSECEADQILSQYQDGCKVPGWAKINVAKALKQGILQDTMTPNMIKPCEDASRADVASMLAKARIALCIDKAEPTGCACDNTQNAYMESCETLSIPTLKVQFGDRISASTSNVGDHFAGKTIDPIVINGVTYPACSRVEGIVTDVERPSGKCSGGLKIALTDIKNCDCETKLPRQILNAQIECAKEQNWFSRLVQAPFTLVGGTLGIAGRTVGGVVVNLANAAENVTNGVGVGTAELFSFTDPACSCCDGTNKFASAGRSYKDAIVDLATAPVDVVRSTISGAAGVLQNAGDEVGYLVDPDGKKISIINPDEKVSFAFDVNSSSAAAPAANCCPCDCECDCK